MAVPPPTIAPGGRFGPVIASRASQENASASTSLTINVPSGTTDGDLLVAVICFESGATNQVAGDNVSGWNWAGSDGNSTSDVSVGIFWRIADSEPASYTWTNGSSNDKCGVIYRITGASELGPIQLTSDAERTLSQGTTASCPAITTEVDDMLVLSIVGWDGADMVPLDSITSGWSIEDELTGGSASLGAGLSVGSKGQATAGSTGACVHDAAASLSDGYIAFQIAIAEPQTVTTGPVIASSTFAGNATTGSTLDLSKPSGVSSGDLLVIVVANDDSTASGPGTTEFTTPTGWTLEDDGGDSTSDVTYAVFSRIADGTEGATETITQAFNRYFCGCYLRITGAAGSSPVSLVGTTVITTSSNRPTEFEVVTVPDDGSLLLAFSVHDGADQVRPTAGDGEPTTVGLLWEHVDDIASPDADDTDGCGLILSSSVQDSGSMFKGGQLANAGSVFDGQALLTLTIEPSSASVVEFVADLTATADLTAGLTNDPSEFGPLEVQATADLTTNPVAERAVVADLATTADMTAALAVETVVDFQASLAATSDLTVQAEVERALAAALDPSADLAADVVADRGLEADLAASGDLVAVLTVETVSEVTFQATLDTTADLTAAVELDTGFVAVLTATADLTVSPVADRELAASLGATADLVASLLRDPGFLAVLHSTADLEVAPIKRRAGLAADLQATADLGAQFRTDPGFVASLGATADLSAGLERERGLQASLQVLAELAAQHGRDPAFAATLQASADLDVADILRQTQLAAALGVDVGVATRFTREAVLGASLAALADLTAQLRGERPLQAELAAAIDLDVGLDLTRDGFAAHLQALVEATTSLTVLRAIDLSCGEVHEIQVSLGATADLGAELQVLLAEEKYFQAALEADVEIGVDVFAENVCAHPFASGDMVATLSVERTLAGSLLATVNLLVQALDVELYVLQAIAAWRVPGAATGFTPPRAARTWRPEASAGTKTWSR